MAVLLSQIDAEIHQEPPQVVHISGSLQEVDLSRRSHLSGLCAYPLTSFSSALISAIDAFHLYLADVALGLTYARNFIKTFSSSRSSRTSPPDPIMHHREMMP